MQTAHAIPARAASRRRSWSNPRRVSRWRSTSTLDGIRKMPRRLFGRRSCFPPRYLCLRRAIHWIFHTLHPRRVRPWHRHCRRPARCRRLLRGKQRFKHRVWDWGDLHHRLVWVFPPSFRIRDHRQRACLCLRQWILVRWVLLSLPFRLSWSHCLGHLLL